MHIHGLQQAGGFTITSAPKEAQPGTGSETGSRDGYLELAVQKSPRNPPAAWLWRPETEILGCDLHVRVGGSFVWPPPGLDPTSITRAVFVAGGVGIKSVALLPKLVCSMVYLFFYRFINLSNVNLLRSTPKPRITAFCAQLSLHNKASFIERLVFCALLLAPKFAIRRRIFAE